MFIKVLRSKIHRATVTENNLNYAGSITIDRDLMDAAGLYEFETVLVANVNNGTRHETYVIEGERGSGVICLNGAAARLCMVGDIVLVLSFAYMTAEELADHQPVVVLADEHNAVKERIVK